MTDFSEYRLRSKGSFVNEVSSSPFSINFNQKNGVYSGSFILKLKDINLLVPWGNNRGEMDLNGEIFTQDDGKMSAQGYANFSGEILAFPNFPHELDDFYAFVTFKELNFTLQSLQGTMGGGNVESNGHLIVKDGELSDLLINFNGKNMTLYPMDRTSCDLTANLSLKYQSEKLLLQGTLDFLSAVWEREIDEAVYFNTNASLSPSESKILDVLEFDLKLSGKDNILIDNTFGKLQCNFDLKLTGNYDFPVITGIIESRDGGVYFSDRVFDVIKAKMVFNNRFSIDPSVDIESELFLKDYRIKFIIKGTSSRPSPSFSSSPPLPPQDILALISLGELFKRPTSTTLSSQIVTTGMFTTQLTDQIKKRTKKLFGDYVLKINPNIEGTSLETLTIGKPISKNFMIVYSTKFAPAAGEQAVVYFQYQLSPTLSLIGMRNEEGNYSLDLRFRKRH